MLILMQDAKSKAGQKGTGDSGKGKVSAPGDKGKSSAKDSAAGARYVLHGRICFSQVLHVCCDALISLQSMVLFLLCEYEYLYRFSLRISGISLLHFMPYGLEKLARGCGCRKSTAVKDGVSLASMDIFAGCGGLTEGLHQVRANKSAA